jgi:hypothetical protein
MANAVTELKKVAGSLPEDLAEQVLSYALFLQSRPANVQRGKQESEGDAEWERILADKQPRPKLEARLRQVKKQVAAGKSEPLDFSRL